MLVRPRERAALARRPGHRATCASAGCGAPPRSRSVRRDTRRAAPSGRGGCRRARRASTGSPRRTSRPSTCATDRGRAPRRRRPARGTAGERHGHRVAAEVVRLAPPPHGREAGAPVALHVRGRAVEVPARRRSPSRRAPAATERAPVLAQARQTAARARCRATGRGHGDDVVQLGASTPSKRTCRASPAKAVPIRDAAAVGDWGRRGSPGASSAGLRRHADERPAGADAAQDDRRASVGPGEAARTSHPSAELGLSCAAPSRWPRARRGRSRRGRRRARARRCRPRSRCGGP